jgi:hypothetical protein
LLSAGQRLNQENYSGRAQPRNSFSVTRSGTPFDKSPTGRWIHNRHNEPNRISLTIKTKHPAQETAHESAGNTEKGRNNESSRIAARHKKLRDDPDD